ncbi:DUF7159 family protein [Mycolicibacterium lutetiense]|uniref:DUF7159 domain-containing protein n=1 Tax=Mycolicibacterium lutetiense TaxID=1641992 RepID=A0ABS4ZUE4_9MYCO|nr:hypothetical protein [Mycolicibacterium lutetiense]MBP2452199.1 hypothetical protein [Mycolicibacterium lutetiense]
MYVDAVLGVSLTPSTVGLVLVEGCEADGATVDHDALDIRGLAPARTDDICADVVKAARRVERVAAERGLRLTAIGVTWSSGAAAEGAALLRKFADAGFADVVPVRLPQATDALARRVAGIVGFDTTSVCVLEPDVVQAMTVGGNNPVQTAVSRGIETVAGLTTWLADILGAADPRPDALVVVGSAVDLDSVLPKLQQALRVPVFTPAEPGLPLARGAALASVRRDRSTFDDDGVAPSGWRWPARQLTPLAILVGGVLAFAVSLSLAIGQQLIPGSEPTPHKSTRPVVSTSGDSAAVPQTSAVMSAVPTASISEAPSVLEPVVQDAQPEYVIDESTMVPPETTAWPDELMAPELQPEAPVDPAMPPPESGQQPLPAGEAPPDPQAETVVPPAPPPPTPELPPVPEAPPPTVEPAVPAPEAVVPVPEPALSEPVAP